MDSIENYEENRESLETLEIVGDGNSNSSPKQSIQLKMHCFTYNNYKEEDIEILETTLKHFAKIEKYVFQETCSSCKKVFSQVD